MMLDRRLILNFDWTLLLLALFLAIWGVFAIYSATNGQVETGLDTLYMKQLLWVIYGLIGLVIFLTIDYQRIGNYAYPLYGGILLLLLLTLQFGTVVSGARRWLSVGFISFQPSELAKIVLILVLAKYFDENRRGYYYLRDLLVPFVLVLAPCLLVFWQPDLGTTLLLFLNSFLLIIVAGLHWKSLLILGIFGGALIPPMWLYFLKDYQKERVLTLFDPESDPLGAGYHILQSKIAIGSGGFSGKGLFAGTQSGLNFLPEKHTDFIFSTLAEELGFIGSSLLLVLYLCLLLKGLYIAYRSKDRLGALIAFGVVTMMGTAIIANIGMTLGLLPVVGIPLPLISYGGSSVVSTLLGVGLLLNVRMQRFKIL